MVINSAAIAAGGGTMYPDQGNTQIQGGVMDRSSVKGPKITDSTKAKQVTIKK